MYIVILLRYVTALSERIGRNRTHSNSITKKGKIFYIKQVKQEKVKKEIVLENHRNNIQLHTLKIQKQTL